MIYRLLTLAALLSTVAGCTVLKQVAPAPGANHALVAPPPDPHQMMIEGRKDEFLRKLAMCESGMSGPSERRIYGGRGIYHGPFQFTIRTLQGWALQMDGTALTIKEATDVAHDYDRAAVIAKYAIFELDSISHWPACNRKHGLATEVRAIKAL
jgi:hypothetical protein